jgi:hypothetical protein
MSFENMDVGTGAPESAAVGQTSFDEVSAVVEKVEAEAKAEAKAEKSEVAKIASEVAKKIGATTDGKESVVEPVQAAAPAKLVKAYHGGKEIEIDQDAEFDVKIDGKVERMKLADIRNQVSGKVNWDRKNNELHQSKKQFEDQVKFVNSQVDNILQLAQTKPEAALFELARLAGKSPQEYAKMLSGSMEGAQRWSDMTEAEQRATLAEAENFGYKAEAERVKKADESAKAEATRTEKINGMAQEIGLDDDEIKGLVSDIQRLTDVKVPDAGHIYTAWVFKTVQESFEAMAPEALKANPNLFGETANVLLSNGIRNKADVEHIIKQAYGEDDSSARKVGRKIAAASSQAGKQTESAASNPKKELVSFDDV